MKIAAKPTLPGNRLSTTTIKHAMDTNRATNNGNTIELSISVIPLYFPTHCNYLDWSLFSTTAIAPPLPLIGSTAALTAAPSTGTTTPASAYTFDRAMMMLMTMMMIYQSNAMTTISMITSSPLWQSKSMPLTFISRKLWPPMTSSRPIQTTTALTLLV